MNNLAMDVFFPKEKNSEPNANAYITKPDCIVQIAPTYSSFNEKKRLFADLTFLFKFIASFINYYLLFKQIPVILA